MADRVEQMLESLDRSPLAWLDQRIVIRLSPSDEALPTGTRLGEFVVVEPLARGGMGDVYRARQSGIQDREVALKVLREPVGDPEARTRFEREANLLAAIRHPSLPVVYGAGARDGYRFLAMQLITGRDLAALMHQWRADGEHDSAGFPRRVVQLLLPAFRGLAELHRRGLVHRDVKPANLMAESEPGRELENGFSYLLDFGLARPIDATDLTRPGGTLLTRKFASPEQHFDEELDARSDVFSAGATLHAVLCSQEWAEDRCAAGGLERLDTLEPAFDRRLADVIATATSPHRADRFASGEKLVDALEAWLHRPHAFARVGRRVGGVALVLGVLAAVFFVFFEPRPADASNPSVWRAGTARRIGTGTAEFSGTLSAEVAFGRSVAFLGDVDRDGVADLAVGAPREHVAGAPEGTFRGAVWILFLTPHGSVRLTRKVELPVHRTTGELGDHDMFGSALAPLGDIDGDGVPDLAVGAPGSSDGASGAGAVWVLRLDTDGGIRAAREISATSGDAGVEALPQDGQFGNSLAVLERDADRVRLAVGANGDRIAGERTGAVWLIDLNPRGAVEWTRRIDATTPGFARRPKLELGYSLASLGDLNQDGVHDLAAGAPFDGAGVVWILFLGNGGELLHARPIEGPVDGAHRRFGESVCALRPATDGATELLVGSLGPAGSDRADVVWRLGLGPSGAPGPWSRLHSPTHELAGRPNHAFGQSLAARLERKGAYQVAVGATSDPGASRKEGAVWLLSD